MGARSRRRVADGARPHAEAARRRPRGRLRGRVLRGVGRSRRSRPSSRPPRQSGLRSSSASAACSSPAMVRRRRHRDARPPRSPRSPERARVPVAASSSTRRTRWSSRCAALDAGFNAVMMHTGRIVYDRSGSTTSRELAAARPRARSGRRGGARGSARTRRAATRSTAPAASLTDPDEAAAFVAATGVDCLAVSVGNVHLLSGANGDIDLDRLRGDPQPGPRPARRSTAAPASRPRRSRQRSPAGVAKFNVGTVLRAGVPPRAHRRRGRAAPRARRPRLSARTGRPTCCEAGRRRWFASVRELIRLYGGAGRAELEPSTPLDLYRQMLLIRRFEERVYFLFLEGEIPGTLHQYQGQEAVAVGICDLLGRDGLDHLHPPAARPRAGKGREPAGRDGRALREGAPGCCAGKGGSMHLGDPAVGMLPAIAIVGGGNTVVTGLGLAFQLRRTDQVAVCFFGDGATQRRAPSTRGSTSPPFGGCRSSSSARTTSTVPRRRSTRSRALVDVADACRRVRYPRSRRRRHGRPRRARGGARGGCDGARRRRPDAPRVQDVSLRRAQPERRARLPRAATRRRRGQARDPIPRLRRQLLDGGEADEAAPRPCCARSTRSSRMRSSSRAPRPIADPSEMLHDVYA